jgi:hypothetical protein
MVLNERLFIFSMASRKASHVLERRGDVQGFMALKSHGTNQSEFKHAVC